DATLCPERIGSISTVAMQKSGPTVACIGLACCAVDDYIGRCATRSLTPAAIRRSHHDRPALLDHAERPPDHDLSRGVRAAVPDHPGEYRQGPAVRARVSGDRPEQSHP